ncbi:glycosyltransferase family 4 protein [Virgibacillus necropolis]|uniref:Glycosyltransferase WbuB n=1 Tax=Virgibacillus necropolis TaxID=163877 RepID=A0A221M990_9BACI|nr:glycosyltransferase family 4 protein [Virgibacillus necropolis]ASN04226.1 glycosyltransferase WbuB [Virgibacillus necropolis]
MKKVLYLHQYFQTNSSSGGTRSYEFAKYLSDNNNDINIITGTEQSTDENNDNFTVISTNTKYNNKMSKWRRILSFVSYIIKAIIKGLQLKNLDIIYATSTPLTIGFPAVFLSKVKRKKLLFEVRDVWPDVPIELGYINNKVIIKALKRFELWIYKNSDHIIVLSTGMRSNLINKGVSPNKITVIENFSNLYLYDKEELEFSNFDIDNKFTCIHPGTMGHVNGLDFILDVAKKVNEIDKEIVFLLIGEGNRKPHLINRVENENISNVKIKDALPKNEIVNIIKQSDIGIMSVDNKYKILEDNSANKFFDFLASGLPILINYGGWQKDILENKKAGRSDITPESMANSILEIKHNIYLKKEIGNNSRLLAEEKFSDLIAKEKLLNIINEI